MPDVAPDLHASSASASDGAPVAPVPPEPAPLSEADPAQRIVPGPYSAPMSIRAAARFAQVATGGPTFAGLGRGYPGGRLIVLALVFVALLAAGGVGTALAFRFGGHHAHAAPLPAEPNPSP